MNAKSILTNIYTSNEIAECLLKIDSDIRDDLKQHVFLLLFEKDENFIIELHQQDKLRNYIVKVMFNLVHFTQDKFHRVNRRQTEILTNDFDEDITDDREVDLLPKLEMEMQNIYWYNKHMLELYVELGTYKSVSEKTGIAIRSVANAVEKAKKQLKHNVICGL